MSFDLAVFSNQSCVTGTQLLPKDSHPRKYCRNLYRLIFQRLYPKTNRIAPGTSTGRLRAAYMRNSVSGHSSRPLPQRRQRRFPALAPRQICTRSPRRNPKGGIQPQSRPGALSGIRRVGKKSDRSLGRDSSLMRIVFRIGLLTRAVQTDNATIFYKTRSW